jgi:hypothetical protein
MFGVAMRLAEMLRVWLGARIILSYADERHRHVKRFSQC